jgi:hypothetical protein
MFPASHLPEIFNLFGDMTVANLYDDTVPEQGNGFSFFHVHKTPPSIYLQLFFVCQLSISHIGESVSIPLSVQIKINCCRCDGGVWKKDNLG